MEDDQRCTSCQAVDMKHLHGTGDLASNGLRRSDILAENRIGARIGRRGAMLASVVVMMAAAGLLAGLHWLTRFPHWLGFAILVALGVSASGWVLLGRSGKVPQGG